MIKDKSILLIIGSLGSGGTERVVSTLAGEMSDIGNKVTLATFDDVQNDFYALDPSVGRVSIGGYWRSSNLVHAIFGNLWRLVKLRYLVKLCKPDAVYSFLPQTNVLVLLATCGISCPIIVSERNWPNQEVLDPLWRLGRQFTYKRAFVVTANSEEIRLGLEKILHRKVVRVDNPIELPVWDSISLRKDRVILVVGRLVNQKGLDFLIQVFSRSHQKFSDWQLIILGKGEEEGRLNQIIKENQLENQVKLMGEVSDTHLWYDKASLFMLTSHYEGTPNSALEAMAWGIPLLATDTCGGLADLLTHKVDGFIVNRTEDSVLEAMSWIHENPKQTALIGVAGRKSIERFDKRLVADSWLALIGGDRVNGKSDG